jgi:hypothetical protein
MDLFLSENSNIFILSSCKVLDEFFFAGLVHNEYSFASCLLQMIVSSFLSREGNIAPVCTEKYIIEVSDIKAALFPS